MAKHSKGRTDDAAITEADLEAALSEKVASFNDVLKVCQYLGKQLQGIPQEHRKLTVARLLNKARDLAKEGDALGTMMLTVVATSWDDFSN